ncbi:MAG: asparaginase domain-containing protein [Reinekea sp.]
MATFLIVNTGGTIGMVASPEGLTPKAGVINEAMQSHPALAAWRDHKLHWQQWSPLQDSSDLQPEHWFRLRESIQAQTGIDGVLIIHGTDTLSYSGAALSYLLADSHFPIVLTGSMKPVLAPETDAIDNLMLALDALTSRPGGVYIAVGSSLLPAALTTKRSTLTHDAFDAPAWSGDWNPIETKPQAFKRSWRSPKIAVFTLFPGFDPVQISQVITSGVSAILINAFGNGNAANTEAMHQALAQASAAAVPVFVRSQCYEGLVNIGQYAASGLFGHAAAVSCGLMTFEAALTKLLLLCNELDSAESIRLAFQQAISFEWESTRRYTKA